MTKENFALTFKSATLYAVRVVLDDSDTSTLIEHLNQRLTRLGNLITSLYSS